jgi:phosphohistidine phosphatase
MAVSRLYLLRHAKAAWAAPGMRDFDRPLERSGRNDAAAIGLAMRERGYVPEVTLCSGARRTRETLECVAEHADLGRVAFSDTLYRADAAGYLDIVRRHDGDGPVLVIGHNPMMEDLAAAIAPVGEASARAAIAAGFPTCGLAVIRLAGRLAEAELGAGFLEAFVTPAEL